MAWKQPQLRRKTTNIHFGEFQLQFIYWGKNQEQVTTIKIGQQNEFDFLSCHDDTYGLLGLAFPNAPSRNNPVAKMLPLVTF